MNNKKAAFDLLSSSLYESLKKKPKEINSAKNKPSLADESIELSESSVLTYSERIELERTKKLKSVLEFLNNPLNIKNNFEQKDEIFKPKKFKDIDFSNLPIYKHKKAIIKGVRSKDTFVIVSTTGSGKSTQVARYLLTAELCGNKMIGITQPRRLATISLATRVAQETDTNIGGLIGYSVRFEHRFDKSTKIKFMTDGILIREANKDPFLRDYSIIILDEAHERSLNTDVLFGVVKNAQEMRVKNDLKALKIVIMSATINADTFLNYFGGNCDKLSITTTLNPLKILCLKESRENYVRDSVITCLNLHIGTIITPGITDFVSNTTHSILIFLTGEDEIDRCCSILNEENKNLIERKERGLIIYPLYSSLATERQELAIAPGDGNCRHIIVSTNIAETSITIPGVRIVIDSGYCKQKFLNPDSGLESLKICRISQAQAEQRGGRASRLGAGICIRLYTDKEYENDMTRNTSPEVMRSSLMMVSLTILGFGFDNVIQFPWFDMPDKKQLTHSMVVLKHLGAIETINNSNSITIIGKKLLEFPLDPRLSFSLLEAARNDRRCLADVSAIVSMLTVAEKLFFKDKTDDKESCNVTNIKVEMYSYYGDLIFLLKIYRTFCKFKTAQEQRDWCKIHLIKIAEMKRAVLTNKQLKAICQRIELPVLTCQDHFDHIVKCFIKPYASQIAKMCVTKKKTKNDYLRPSSYSREYRNPAIGDISLFLHPSSVLCRSAKSPEIVLYIESIVTDRTNIRYLSYIKSEWLNE